jgi:hypothetical protein
MSSNGRSFSSYSLHIGDDWLVRCSTYDETTPILALDAGPSAVCITTRGKDANTAAVEFARALADSARKFADEMERMHAAQLDGGGTDKAADSDAA